MTKRLRIPRLDPTGVHAQIITHQQPRPRYQSKQDDKTRLKNEPWRAKGYDKRYRKARQKVIAAQGGRCKVCGKKVAELTSNGRWSCARLGGQTHHTNALCNGGNSEASNLILVCPTCHARLDAERRRGDRG